MSSYSKSKISAFFGSHHDNQLRESIRRDVLIERYDDIKKEISHLEDLLDISEEDFNENLFAINEILFEMIEELVPELVEEEDVDEEENVEEQKADAGTVAATAKKAAATKKADPAAERKKLVAKIKKREGTAIAIAKDKEHLLRAKSSIRSAGLVSKGSKTPEARIRSMKTIAKAKKTLANIGKNKK